MSFGSALKKVGKVALKVAPMAANFIPGGGLVAQGVKAGIGMAAGKASQKIDSKSAGGGASPAGDRTPMDEKGPSSGPSSLSSDTSSKDTVSKKLNSGRSWASRSMGSR